MKIALSLNPNRRPRWQLARDLVRAADHHAIRSSAQ
jgi:hypothetical protein